jgi:hypothetical protein
MNLNGTTIFCSHNGCVKKFISASPHLEVVRLEAEEAGWTVDLDSMGCYCPIHRGESGLGAMVPAFPPSRSPGTYVLTEEMVIEKVLVGCPA